MRGRVQASIVTNIPSVNETDVKLDFIVRFYREKEGEKERFCEEKREGRGQRETKRDMDKRLWLRSNLSVFSVVGRSNFNEVLPLVLVVIPRRYPTIISRS